MEFLKKSRKIIFGLLCVVGFGLSIYTLQHHLLLESQGATNSICNVNALVNCDAVAASEYSEFFGLPLGVFGAGYFFCLFLLYLNSIVKFRPPFFTLGILGDKSERSDGQTLLLTSLVGLLVIFVLGGISLLKIGSVCAMCIGIYICVFVTTHLLIFDAKRLLPFSANEIFNGVFKAVLYVLFIVVLLSKMYIPSTDPTVDSSKTKTAQESSATSNASLDIDISTSPYKGFGEDYRLGPDEAPVTIVEFADLECPACSYMFNLLKEIRQKYQDQVRVVFKNYPLSSECNPSTQRVMHKFACSAARMARCAGMYGYFWEYLDLAFTNQKEISDDAIKQWAEDVGLTEDQIAACDASISINAKIKSDAELGTKLNIQGTPTVFINGKLYKGGFDLSQLEEAINKEL